MLLGAKRGGRPRTRIIVHEYCALWVFPDCSTPMFYFAPRNDGPECIRFTAVYIKPYFLRRRQWARRAKHRFFNEKIRPSTSRNGAQSHAHRAARFARVSGVRAYLRYRAYGARLSSVEGLRVGAPRRRQWARRATHRKARPRRTEKNKTTVYDSTKSPTYRGSHYVWGVVKTPENELQKPNFVPRWLGVQGLV